MEEQEKLSNKNTNIVWATQIQTVKVMKNC